MKRELLTYRDPKSPVSEVFRTLRTNIQFMNTDNKLETLLVTSTSPGEGKSWVTSNLAITFAQAGKRVILVDADMRKGRQYKIFEIQPKPGLSNFLAEYNIDNTEHMSSGIKSYLQDTEVENLKVLTAGSVPPNPSELLVSRKMRRLLEGLKELCEIVIIDGTPCDLVTDSIILSKFVDSTIIVTAQKETKKDRLTKIVKNIKNVGGKIAGVVVNKVEVSTKKYNDSYYYGSISARNIKSPKAKRGHKRETEQRAKSSVPPQKREQTSRISSERKEEIDLPKAATKPKKDNTKDRSNDKVDEIMNLVNDYIEKKQERKY